MSLMLLDCLSIITVKDLFFSHFHLWFHQIGFNGLPFPQKVSADTAKKRINSLSLELIEAKNKLDVKDKVRV